MDPSNFIIALQNNKCNIIYHTPTNSFNITNINNYIFSKSLNNYYNIIKKLNKKEKMSYKRPIKLELDFDYDMRKASILYKGFYSNDLITVRKILNENYSYFTYDDFIFDLKKMYLDKLNKYDNYIKIQSEKLNKQFKKVNMKATAILTKNNILIVKNFLADLNKTIYNYNLLIIQFGEKCNINVIHLLYDKIKIQEYIEIVNDIYLTLNIKKYNDLTINNNILNELFETATLFHNVIIKISNINTGIGIHINKFINFKLPIYDCNKNCCKINEFIINNKEKYDYLKYLLIDVLNNHIKNFNPIISNIDNIYKLQKDYILDYNLYEKECNNILEIKKIFNILLISDVKK